MIYLQTSSFCDKSRYQYMSNAFASKRHSFLAEVHSASNSIASSSSEDDFVQFLGTLSDAINGVRRTLPMTLVANCDASLPVEIATNKSLVEYDSSVHVADPIKREYLMDYKKSTYWRSLLTSLTKTLLVASLPHYIEYLKYLERLTAWEAQQQQQEEDESEDDLTPPPEFNFESHFNAIVNVLPKIGFRFVTTDVVLLGIYNNVVTSNLSARLADKYTKKIADSLSRKLAKYSRFTACYRGFFSSVRGSALLSLATLTWDLLEGGYLALFTKPDQKEKATSAIVRYTALPLWVSKKVAYHTLVTLARALGLSLGTYVFFGNVNYGGGLGSLIFEFIAGGVFENLLC